MALAAVTVICGCSDDNDSTLSAFDMPGALHYVEQCVIGDVIKPVSECQAQNMEPNRSIFVGNIGNGTLAYITVSAKGKFEVHDITRSVPGVTSIPVGDRPQSIASDANGVLLLTTSSIHNNLSIVSVPELREVAYLELDKPARRIAYHAADDAFYVYFLDGLVRRLKISFDCGQGENVFPLSCKLSKENLTLSWEDVMTLDGQVSDYIVDPRGDRGYVSYSNHPYISLISFAESGGACPDGATYPCEVERIGAGFSCSDGIDNNGDGLIDQEDPLCYYPWSAEGAENPGYVGIGPCNDNRDNDGDGLVDALDPGCVSSDDASEEDGYQPPTLGTCADGIDNDGDGFSDRDDPSCIWPMDDESSDKKMASRTTGMCMDGVDNDADTLIDDADKACYGRLGRSEAYEVGIGRGQLGIDPESRWLYVADPYDSQVIIIDLETNKTLDASGHFPRQRVVGIPVGRVPLDVVGDILYYDTYNKNNQIVEVKEALIYVTTSSGGVVELSVQQDFIHFEHLETDERRENLPVMTLRPSDDDDDISYIGVARCVGRLCGEHDIPTINLRERLNVAFSRSENQLTVTDPQTGAYHTTIFDPILASETWRVAYEGPLEKKEREDGYFSSEGVFRSYSADFCALGVREGDLLVLTSKPTNTTTEACAPFSRFAKEPVNLQWKVKAVHTEYLEIEPTGVDGDATSIPPIECFPRVFSFNLHAIGSWILTSNSTYVNRRMALGDQCVDNPISPFGNLRFNLDPNRNANTPDLETAFFSIRLPDSAFQLGRNDAYEFTTKSEFTQKGTTVGAAPTSAILYDDGNIHYLIISEASANTVVLYDLEDESIYDSL